MSHAAGQVTLVIGVASIQGILALAEHVATEADNGAAEHGHVQRRKRPASDR